MNPSQLILPFLILCFISGCGQTLENLKKMYDMATFIPTIMFALMALLLFVVYPLSKKKVAELQVLKEAKLKESYENNTIDIQ